MCEANNVSLATEMKVAESIQPSSFERLNSAIQEVANAYFCVPIDPSRLQKTAASIRLDGMQGESTDAKHSDLALLYGVRPRERFPEDS